MEECLDNTHMWSSVTNINSTFLFDEDKSSPTRIKKEVSSYIVIDTIRQSIIEQYEYNFGEQPETQYLEMLVNGFVLFNLHKNKYMLKNKHSLLKYVKDRSISVEEKGYFLDILLYNQRPQFLTIDEHECLR
jgi:hypothetical protein